MPAVTGSTPMVALLRRGDGGGAASGRNNHDGDTAHRGGFVAGERAGGDVCAR